MSEQALILTRPDIAGMSRLHVGLSESPTPGELEQARMRIFGRLADASRGIVLDLHDIKTTSTDALVMLQSAKTYAASEGKRLILYNVSAELMRLIQDHGQIFEFEVYGYAKKSQKAASKPKRKTPKLSPVARQRLRNIVLPVLILFPIVAAVQWYVVFYTPVNAVGLTQQKTFEPGKEKFIVEGLVERLDRGDRTKVGNATVVVWVTERGVGKVRNAWLTETGSDGRFKLPLPLDSTLRSLGVRVAITANRTLGEGESAASSAFRDAYISQQVIEQYQPLEVHAVF